MDIQVIYKNRPITFTDVSQPTVQPFKKSYATGTSPDFLVDVISTAFCVRESVDYGRSEADFYMFRQQKSKRIRNTLSDLNKEHSACMKRCANMCFWSIRKGLKPAARGKGSTGQEMATTSPSSIHGTHLQFHPGRGGGNKAGDNS